VCGVGVFVCLCVLCVICCVCLFVCVCVYDLVDFVHLGEHIAISKSHSIYRWTLFLSPCTPWSRSPATQSLKYAGLLKSYVYYFA
jgi:hypothetical protein